MGRAVGIDLGTTNSVVAVLEAGQVTIIPNAEGSRTTPSVVAFSKSGAVLVGDVAKRQAVTNVERTIKSAKRHMGTSWCVNIDDKDYHAEEILAFVLEKLKHDAEAFLHEEVTDAVITVPAYYNDAQRQATKHAGAIAGFNVLRIVNEPTAAALAYSTAVTVGQTILVFDLGGGTFDVSLLSVDQDETGFTTVQVISTSGDNHLGGDDWDSEIVSVLADAFDDDNATNIVADPIAQQRLVEVAEEAKKLLSAMQATDVNLPYLAMKDQKPLHLSHNLSRHQFEVATSHLLERCRKPLAQALEDSELTLADIDHVVMVGGSTRMPAVTELVTALTGKAPFKGVSPDEVVAIGAAVQAAVLAGARDDVLLIDVTPLSLGIETRGGEVAVMVERNTAIPVRCSRTFTTSVDDQQVLRIKVYQGESRKAAENVLLGTFAFTDIPPAPRGIPQIEVSFNIDANGIVSVNAVDKDTGQAHNLTINRADGYNEEVESAVEQRAAQKAAQQSKEAESAAVQLAQVVLSDVRTILSAAPTLADETEVLYAQLDVLALMINDPKTSSDALKSSALETARSALTFAEGMGVSIPMTLSDTIAEAR